MAEEGFSLTRRAVVQLADCYRRTLAYRPNGAHLPGALVHGPQTPHHDWVQLDSATAETGETVYDGKRITHDGQADSWDHDNDVWVRFANSITPDTANRYWARLEDTYTVGSDERDLYVVGATGDVQIVEALWRYDGTATVMADPGSGKVRFNNASASLTDALALSIYTDSSTDRTQLLATLAGGDTLHIQDQDDATNYVRYSIDTTPDNNGTWFKIPVTYVNGSGTMPSNNERLLLTFYEAGGGGGGSGTVTGTGTYNRVPKWDAPGTGLVNSNIYDTGSIISAIAPTIIVTDDLTTPTATLNILLGAGLVTFEGVASGVTVTASPTLTTMIADGPSVKVGFYGTSPGAGQQTLITDLADPNSALKGLYAALDNLGLIVDGTSPTTKVSAYAAGNRTLGHTTLLGTPPGYWVIIPFDTEVEDTLGEFNPATYTFTPTSAGTYLIRATTLCGNNQGTRVIGSLFGAGNVEVTRFADTSGPGAGGLTLVNLTAGVGYTFRVYVVAESNNEALGGSSNNGLLIRRFY